MPDPSLNTMKQVIEELEINIDVVIKHLNMNQLWKVGSGGGGGVTVMPHLTSCSDV